MGHVHRKSTRTGLLVMVTLAALLLGACDDDGLTGLRGSGNISTESRAVQGFNRIAVSGSAEVVLTQGPEEALTVAADDNLLEHVRTEVTGDTLSLGFESGRYAPSEPLQFNVTVQELRGLHLSGATRVDAAHITTDRLGVSASGSSKITLAGQATVQDVSSSGSSQYDAGQLESETVTVTASGVSNVTVWANAELEVRTSGSSSVRYYGRPRLNQSISGSGSLTSLGNK